MVGADSLQRTSWCSELVEQCTASCICRIVTRCRFDVELHSNVGKHCAGATLLACACYGNKGRTAALLMASTDQGSQSCCCRAVRVPVRMQGCRCMRRRARGTPASWRTCCAGTPTRACATPRRRPRCCAPRAAALWAPWRYAVLDSATQVCIGSEPKMLLRAARHSFVGAVEVAPAGFSARRLLCGHLAAHPWCAHCGALRLWTSVVIKSAGWQSPSAHVLLVCSMRCAAVKLDSEVSLAAGAEHGRRGCGRMAKKGTTGLRGVARQALSTGGVDVDIQP